jgi:hypothetical protein
MPIVIVGENALDVETWEDFEVDDLCAFLVERYGNSFPSTGRIYHEEVAEECDVTPSCSSTVERLQGMDGTFYVVIYPAEPVTIITAAIGAASVVGGVAVARRAARRAAASIPQIPAESAAPPPPQIIAEERISASSPNNALAERQNRARPNGRIPDIFGSVVSVPDLLTETHYVFDTDQQVELSYLCVGRGQYDIPATGIREGSTQIQDIPGSSIEIYGPNTSPNSGDNPEIIIGRKIGRQVRRVTRATGVNNQLLPPRQSQTSTVSAVPLINGGIVNSNPGVVNFEQLYSSGDIVTVSNFTSTMTIGSPGVSVTVEMIFKDGGRIEFPNGVPSQLSAGASITISNAVRNHTIGTGSSDFSAQYVLNLVSTNEVELLKPELRASAWANINANFLNGETPSGQSVVDMPSASVTLDLSGTYKVLSVSQSEMNFSDASVVNPNWGTVSRSTPTSFTSAPNTSIVSQDDKWIGPFLIDDPSLNSIDFNFTAPEGLYIRGSNAQEQAGNVELQVEITPVDERQNAIGPVQRQNVTIDGRASFTRFVGNTLSVGLNTTSRSLIRARRLSAPLSAPPGFQNAQIFENIMWDSAFGFSPAPSTFGDVTTVLSSVTSNQASQFITSRRLNMDVTRRIPRLESDGTRTSRLFASSRASDIIASVCLDERIGNRSESEIDFLNIYNTVQAIETYFGTSVATEFNHTFDSLSTSFEETLEVIASAIYCIAYRRGSVIRLSFERRTQNSTLLFNHRNKLPGSETRTVRFDAENGFDGLEYNYVSPDDGAVVTLFLPTDQSAVNPNRVESVGVKNPLQAYFHAHRIFNRQRLQNITTEFSATQESDLVIQRDRILVADNTRPNTQDGQVDAQNGLTLTLSQDVTFETGQTYTIFLQHTDRTVEAIPITAGTQPNQVVLSRAPKAALSLDQDNYAVATYTITSDQSDRETAFLVVEREQQNNFTSQIRAIVYKDEYYAEDDAFTAGRVDINGNPI